MNRLPHFSYILVSGEDDSLSEGTYVSSAFLRRLYPKAEITVLTDSQTKENLSRKRFRLEDHVSEVRSIPIDSQFQTPAARSRYLKTQLRQWFDRDLVFLDSDALPFRRFDELFQSRAAVSAVLDRNAEFPKPHMPTWVKPIFDHYRWHYPLKHYFNTGVLFLADNATTHKLGELWHQRWLDQWKTFGKHFDQPSFNSALNHLGVDVHVMPVQFNAMVEASPYYAREARIIHYFLHGPARELDEKSLLATIMREVRDKGRFEWDEFEEAWQRLDPWVRPTGSLHRALATKDYGDVARVFAKRLSHKFTCHS